MDQSASWLEKKRRLRNKAKRTNNENDWSSYRKVRNKCVGLVWTAKDEFLDKQAAIVDSLGSIQNSYLKICQEFLQQIQFTRH